MKLGPQTIRLRPAPQTRTPVLSYSLTVKPEPHHINWQQLVSRISFLNGDQVSGSDH